MMASLFGLIDQASDLLSDLWLDALGKMGTGTLVFLARNISLIDWSGFGTMTLGHLILSITLMAIHLTIVETILEMLNMRSTCKTADPQIPTTQVDSLVQ
jgi:hypothetical protein